MEDCNQRGNVEEKLLQVGELKWIHTRQKAKIQIPAKRQFFFLFLLYHQFVNINSWKNLWCQPVWGELGFLYLLLCGSRWVFKAECSTFDWFQMCPLKLKVENHFLVQRGHKMELKLRKLTRYISYSQWRLEFGFEEMEPLKLLSTCRREPKKKSQNGSNN